MWLTVSPTYVATSGEVGDLLGAVSELDVGVTDSGIDHPDGVAAASCTGRGRVEVVEGKVPLVDTVQTPGHLGAVDTVLLNVLNSGEVSDLGEDNVDLFID